MRGHHQWFDGGTKIVSRTQTPCVLPWPFHMISRRLGTDFFDGLLVLIALAAMQGSCASPLPDGIGPADFLGVSPSSRQGWSAALDAPARNAAALSLVALAAALQIDDSDERYQADIANRGAGPGSDPEALSDVGAYALLGGALVAPFLLAPHRKLGVSRQSYALTAIYAYTANLALTQATKAAVGRTRPDGSDDRSFFSGHTTNAFTGAQLLYRMYGWKAGVPAYTAAALVAFSRVESSNHFPADVLVGAAAGIWITDLIYEKNHGEAGLFKPAHPVKVAPVVRPDMVGLSLSWSR